MHRPPVRFSLMVACVAALAAVTVGQGCTPPSPPQPLQPTFPPPTAGTVTAYVDPLHGNDATAVPGGAAYRTIQAAVNGLAQVVAVPAQMGAVILLPGRYGYAPGDARYNGEHWPVQVEPGIRIEGANALNVILDGGALAPGATSFVLPSPLGVAPVSAVPCFVMGGNRLYGYTHTLLNRVTIVDADVGVLVTGSGEVDPTIAESLFMNCRVGAQVHSAGGPQEGAHRPRFLWCTFGNCDVGLAVTGESAAGATAPARSWPAVMNCLFKNDRDLEGVPCSAVASCAFAPASVNGSMTIPQPTQNPTTVFDTALYSHRDLFVGARYLDPGLPASAQWFTDWRLTWRTWTPPTSGNPADGAGITTFPASTPNGTSVDVVFGSITVGLESAQGPGTYGPLGGPTGGGSPHLGYRAGGTFIVGGTVPGERRFGPDAGGVMYDVVDIFWRPDGMALALLSVQPPAPPWVPGRRAPLGILDPGLTFGSVLLGEGFLDVLSYPMSDLSVLIASPGTNHQVSIPLGMPPAITGSLALAWQAIIQQGSHLIASDAEVFTVGQ